MELDTADHFVETLYHYRKNVQITVDKYLTGS